MSSNKKMNCSCLDLADPNTCADCRFGFCQRCTYPQAIECRRHSPVAKTSESGLRQPVWPLVSRHDWCGDYMPRETKS